MLNRLAILWSRYTSAGFISLFVCFYRHQVQFLSNQCTNWFLKQTKGKNHTLMGIMWTLNIHFSGHRDLKVSLKDLFQILTLAPERQQREKQTQTTVKIPLTVHSIGWNTSTWLNMVIYLLIWQTVCIVQHTQFHICPHGGALLCHKATLGYLQYNKTVNG